LEFGLVFQGYDVQEDPIEVEKKELGEEANSKKKGGSRLHPVGYQQDLTTARYREKQVA